MLQTFKRTLLRFCKFFNGSIFFSHLCRFTCVCLLHFIYILLCLLKFKKPMCEVYTRNFCIFQSYNYVLGYCLICQVLINQLFKLYKKKSTENFMLNLVLIYNSKNIRQILLLARTALRIQLCSTE